ncbi:hypothetical protein MTP03_18770 [Tsukamurella sp. PLM1]|nr:hypothetical protein MTP03_18770 [Tsukamurella sp. PLM1]
MSAPQTRIAIMAATRFRLRKSENGRIGFLAVRSTTRNETRQTTLIAAAM